MVELLLKDEVYAVVGAALEVYKEMGTGFLEGVYQEAMEIELASRGIPYEPLKGLTIRYKGRLLKKEYIMDLLCYGQPACWPAHQFRQHRPTGMAPIRTLTWFRFVFFRVLSWMTRALFLL